ncbi:MAG: hypothetical protein M1819_004057 [Sarea resinae]|nr:MAG: hypothetical protein M1819_004057 [Sarea resinae]
MSSKLGLTSNSDVDMPTSSEWEDWKEFIRHRYVTENMTLKAIRDELATLGFEVTFPMLQYRVNKAWGIRKT